MEQGHILLTWVKNAPSSCFARRRRPCSNTGGCFWRLVPPGRLYVRIGVVRRTTATATGNDSTERSPCTTPAACPSRRRLWHRHTVDLDQYTQPHMSCSSCHRPSHVVHDATVTTTSTARDSPTEPKMDVLLLPDWGRSLCSIRTLVGTQHARTAPGHPRRRAAVY